MNKQELSDAIRIELQKHGVVRSIRTQIKKEVCQLLTKGPKVRRIQSLEQAAIRSLIMDCLVCDELECTQSVFLSESGLDEYRLSMEDILKAFEIQKGTTLHKMMVQSGEGSTRRTIKDSAVYQMLTQLPDAIAGTINETTHRSSQTMSLVDESDADRTGEEVCADDDMQLSMGRLESRILIFQEECEKREKEKMERELQQFKTSARIEIEEEYAKRRLKEVEESRKAMENEIESNMETMKRKEDQLRKDLLAREKERGYQHLNIRQELTKEIETLKRREHENKNFIEIEQRKLQLEEQRVKHILMNAEAKLEFAETKEKEVLESTTNEFNRARLAAKQTYEDASESVRKQSAFYAKELDSLNALRKNLSTKLKKCELIQIEVSDLRVDNEKLRKVLNRSQTETEQVKKTVETNSTQYRKDLRSIQSRNLELEMELVHAKEELERYKIMATSADEKNKDTSKSLTFKVDTLDAALKKCKLEKSLLFEEVNNLRLLLSRSEGALATINNNCEENNQLFDSSRGLKEINIEADSYATELNDGRSLKSKISKPKFLGKTQNNFSLLGSSAYDANHPNIRGEDFHHEQRIRDKKPSDSASCVYELPQFRHLKSFSTNYEHDIDQAEISSPQMKNDHPSSAIFSDEVNHDAGIVQTKLNNDEIGPKDASAKVVVNENTNTGLKTNGMETSTPDCVPISKTESEILLMNSDGSISDSLFGGAQIDTSKNAIGTGTPHSDGDTIELKPINVEKNDNYVDDDHGYDSSDFEAESLSGL